jgi:hypothetical protein
LFKLAVRLVPPAETTRRMSALRKRGDSRCSQDRALRQY